MSEKIEYPLDAQSYQLLMKVGEGSSAVVYKAFCTNLKEYVAIKILDLEKSNSPINEILVYLFFCIVIIFFRKK
jgi:serine/threonine-protein kinase OSR1/STK39